jgi:Beta-galactosidase
MGNTLKMAWGAALAIMLAGHAAATQLLRVDATSMPAPVSRGYLQMGTSTARDGQTLEVNSRYLELDGKPWLPVMGEFHYVRVPEHDWNAELLKMKASGVDIVSTYVFWNYHEPQPGQFDWRGNRDLRHFVQLCAQDGLKVVLRIGPWAHGEVRFGGLPDWVVQSMPTRRNDPTYLHYVGLFYAQIAEQVRGLWWKDDGPVIGVQIENEYNLDGAGQGAAHIATLKAMARADGMDVPLYTVTGGTHRVSVA